MSNVRNLSVYFIQLLILNVLIIILFKSILQLEIKIMNSYWFTIIYTFQFFSQRGPRLMPCTFSIKKPLIPVFFDLDLLVF